MKHLRKNAAKLDLMEVTHEMTNVLVVGLPTIFLDFRDFCSSKTKSLWLA